MQKKSSTYTPSFSRADSSGLAQWWWTVDKLTLISLVLLMFIGVFMSLSASPAIAERLKLDKFFFVKRHIIYLIPSFIMMISISFLSPKWIRRFGFLLYFSCIILLILTVLWGMEVKGAKRWLNISGFSIQPSEIMKPAFIILSAWMLSEGAKDKKFPGITFSFLSLLLFLSLLIIQPDFGMSFVTALTWIAQLFVLGLPLMWFAILAALGVIGSFGAYIFLPHVAKRIDQFINPSSVNIKHDLYQVHQSLKAFGSGGLFGIGPGEGTIKRRVPDAHADFVFAVAGEEFGLILCLIIVGLFTFIVGRSLVKIMNQRSIFAQLSAFGLLIQFALQAMVNMASSLHLMPTKGMTMPFISYGGSSFLSLGMAMGVVLALTRRNKNYEDL
jgi:cell division protein FtsW